MHAEVTAAVAEWSFLMVKSGRLCVMTNGAWEMTQLLVVRRQLGLGRAGAG